MSKMHGDRGGVKWNLYMTTVCRRTHMTRYLTEIVVLHTLDSTTVTARVARFTFRHLFLQTGPFSEHVFDESTDCRTVCNVIYTIYISHLFLQKLLHRW